MNISIPLTSGHAGRFLTGLTMALLVGTACSDVDRSTTGGTSPARFISAEPASAQSPGTVWVTNRAQHDVTAFDASTGAAIATIPVGRNPIDVVAPRGTRKVYVSNEDSNTVSVISKASLSPVAQIPIPTPNGKPHHMVQSPDGRFVYVAEFGSHRVATINTATDSVIREYEAGANGAKTHAVAVSPDGRTLYAVNSGANEVVALDTQSGEATWRLEVGQNPSEMLVTSTGAIGYVSIRGENTVKVLDLQAHAIVAEIRVGPEPDTLQLTKDGRTLVVALRGTPAYVALVDTDDFSGGRWVRLDGTTTGHQSLSPDGAHTFVAVEGDPAAVEVVDNRAGQSVARFSFPAAGGSATPARPHGIFHDTDTLNPSPR